MNLIAANQRQFTETIKLLGTVGTLRRPVNEGTYNPSTGAIDGLTSRETPVRGILTNSSRFDPERALVEHEGLTFVMSARFNGQPIGFEPEVSDEVIVAGRTYAVKESRRVGDPVTPSFYVLGVDG